MRFAQVLPAQQAVSVSFVVSPQAGVSLMPSGMVTVKANTGENCTASAPSGLCSLTFAGAATRSIGATYPGDANFIASASARVSEVVKKNPSTTTVVTSLTPSSIGQAVTFTATVASTGGAIPGGESVTFKDGATILGTGTTIGSQASFTTGSLAAGTHTITATYGGDLTFAASSGSVKQVVNRFATTTTVTSSLNPSKVGNPVTFTATVSSTGGVIPDGETVTFKNGANILGTRTTVGGQASFTTPSLTAGTHTITAAYAGDASFAASSGTVKQLVNKYATTTVLGSSQNPSLLGQTVTFTHGTTLLGTATTTAGSASISVSTLPHGADTVTAHYAGDARFATSKGSVVEQVN
jgi:hypothetical protein